MQVLEEDATGFVRRVGDEGGGAFVVRFSHAMEKMATAAVENVVQERMGSKALRIFR